MSGKELTVKQKKESLEKLINQYEQYKLNGDHRYKMLEIIIKVIKDRIALK